MSFERFDYADQHSVQALISLCRQSTIN